MNRDSQAFLEIRKRKVVRLIGDLEGETIGEVDFVVIFELVLPVSGIEQTLLPIGIVENARCHHHLRVYS